MPSIFKQNFAIHVKVFVFKWSFVSYDGLQVNMSYLLKGLLFEAKFCSLLKIWPRFFKQIDFAFSAPAQNL